MILKQDRLEWEYCSNLRKWEKYVEKTDADLVETLGTRTPVLSQYMLSIC